MLHDAASQMNISAPADVTVSTHHGGTIHAAMYSFAAVSIAITTLTLAIRAYTKFYLMRQRGWDDYLMILGWLGFVSQWVVLLCAVPFGAGEHEADVEGPKVSPYSELLFVHELMYPWLMGQIKTSIALQLLRIFVPNARSPANHRIKFWTIWIFVGVELAWFLSYFFASLFQCWPVKKTYDWNIPGHCLSGFPAFNVAVSGFNMLSDMLMAIIPLIWIWQLRIPKSKKFGAMAVFFVAILAFAASLLRLIYAINRLAYTDITLTLTQVALSTAAEEAAGILVGNFVTLPRFFCEMIEKYRKIRGITDPTAHPTPCQEKRNSSTPAAFDPLYTSTTETSSIHHHHRNDSGESPRSSHHSRSLPPLSETSSAPSRQRSRSQ